MKSHPFDTKALFAYVESLSKRWAIPAVSVSVVHGNNASRSPTPAIDNAGSGTTSGSGPITPDTLFPIMSITKHFTAVAIGILVDEGKLAWDSKFQDLIPGWKMVDKEAQDGLTVADALSHVSGLPFHIAAGYGRDTPLDRVVDIVGSLQPAAPFRRKSYAAYIHERILAPLNMTRTTFDAASALNSGLTAAVSFDDGTSQEIGWMHGGSPADCLLAPTGGMHSSAADLGKWLRYLLALSKGNNVPGLPHIISQEMYRKITTGRIACGWQVCWPNEPGKGAFEGFSEPMYALGLQTSHYRGIDLVMHSGTRPGAGSLILWAPGGDFGIAVLTNVMYKGVCVASIIAMRAVEMFFDLTPADWEGRTLSLPALWSTAMTLARPPPWLGLNQHEDTDLCGMYTSPAYGKLAVCFPPSDDGDTAYSTYIDTMLAAIRSAKPIGHAHPKPDLLAVMSEHSMIRTYIALFRVSEGTFWGEEHDVVKIGEQWNDMPHTTSQGGSYKGFLLRFFINSSESSEVANGTKPPRGFQLYSRWNADRIDNLQTCDVDETFIQAACI